MTRLRNRAPLLIWLSLLSIGLASVRYFWMKPIAVAQGEALLMKLGLFTAWNTAAVCVALTWIRGRIRVPLVLAVLGLAALLQVGLGIYLRYFHAIPHLGMLSAVFGSEGGELWQVREQISQQLVTSQVIGACIAGIGTLVAGFALARTLPGTLGTRFRPRSWIAGLAVGWLVIFWIYGRNNHFLQQADSQLGIYRGGILQTLLWQSVDLVELKSQASATLPFPGKAVDRIRPQAAPPRSPSYQPTAGTKPNFLLIQVESLDPWAIDAEVHGKPVMPFLRSLRSRCAHYESFFAHHAAGGSSDADLSALLGILPSASSMGISRVRAESVDPLPQVLSEKLGYTTAFFHGNRGSFYERQTQYPKLGFKKLFFKDEYSGAASGWFSKDLPFFEQSLDQIRALPSPWFAYLVTMQSHGPFRNHHGPWPFGAPVPEKISTREHYLWVMNEVDEALRTFFQGVATQPKTTTLLYSDHLSNIDDRWKSDPIQQERIAFFLCGPGVSPGPRNTLGSHSSIAPTVAELAGIPSSELRWVGSSLLQPGPRVEIFAHPPALIQDGETADVRPIALQPHGLDDFRRYSEGVLHGAQVGAKAVPPTLLKQPPAW